jgi:hypothetical protein
LTVVAHELGHELGFEDNDGAGLMGIRLPTGTRRLPDPEQWAGVAAVPAQGATVVAPIPDNADPGRGIVPPDLLAAELGFNHTTWGSLPAEPARGGWRTLFALEMGSPDARRPVLSAPRLPPAAAEDNGPSRLERSGPRPPDGEAVDRAFGGTWVSWLGETFGNDLALDSVG